MEDRPTFKSLPQYFSKEKSEAKPCTVRRIEEGDPRIAALRAGCKEICIKLPDDSDSIICRVTDYTEWEGLAIISFRVIGLRALFG